MQGCSAKDKLSVGKECDFFANIKTQLS